MVFFRCNGGIGNKLAREFHSRGLRVIATARSVEKITDLKECGIECLPLAVDDHASVLNCFDDVKKILGDQGLAFLVNNAGIGTSVRPCVPPEDQRLTKITARSGPATEISLVTARAIFETNFFGVMDINQVFLPLLQKAQGTIVHIGSCGSIAPVPWLSVYDASKAALYSYCDALRLELATLGVKVVYVQTGMVKTPMNERKSTVADDSLYAPVRKAYEDSQGTSEPRGAAPEAYAKEVVSKLLSQGSWWRNDWVIWAGEKASTMKVMSWVASNCPWDLWGFVMRKTYKLG